MAEASTFSPQPTMMIARVGEAIAVGFRPPLPVIAVEWLYKEGYQAVSQGLSGMSPDRFEETVDSPQGGHIVNPDGSQTFIRSQSNFEVPELQQVAEIIHEAELLKAMVEQLIGREVAFDSHLHQLVVGSVSLFTGDTVKGVSHGDTPVVPEQATVQHRPRQTGRLTVPRYRSMTDRRKRPLSGE